MAGAWPPEPYRGATAALATCHGKAQALALPLQQRLGLGLRVAAIDTDAFGSFTGEVARSGSAADAAIAKARAGMAATGLKLGLASEGSFGPHPWLPFGALGVETLAFVDDARGLTVVESAPSRRSNFSSFGVAPGADMAGWLRRIGFPAHGVVVRGRDGAVLAKGVQDSDTLAALLPGATRLETDMRAHMNPTRMVAIRALARRLAARLATPCPACAAPGWGQIGVERGLPCRQCGQGTELVAGLRFGCAACGHEALLPRPDGLAVAEPGDCGWCNP